MKARFTSELSNEAENNRTKIVNLDLVFTAISFLASHTNIAKPSHSFLINKFESQAIASNPAGFNAIATPHQENFFWRKNCKTKNETYPTRANWKKIRIANAAFLSFVDDNKICPMRPRRTKPPL
jgi:hypothetical protein